MLRYDTAFLAFWQYWKKSHYSPSESHFWPNTFTHITCFYWLNGIVPLLVLIGVQRSVLFDVSHNTTFAESQLRFYMTTTGINLPSRNCLLYGVHYFLYKKVAKCFFARTIKVITKLQIEKNCRKKLCFLISS